MSPFSLCLIAVAASAAPADPVPPTRVLIAEAGSYVFTLDPATWTFAYWVQVRYELESASADGKWLAANDPQDSVCDDAYLYDGVTGEYLAAFDAGNDYVSYQVL